MAIAQRFRDTHVEFANGSFGQTINVASANPVNYWQVISDPGRMPPAAIDGKLFLPSESTGAATSRHALVIVVPGSFGIALSHVRHAETLNGLGIATFVLDPFGGRSVASTVADQTQYSFAASAYDVLAALKVLAAHPRIDPARIGAQGHSRGGSAVLTAATSRFSRAVLGGMAPLTAVYAAYPWSGHQFLAPGVGTTRVRAVIGDRDDWCLPQQVQAHMQAIRLAGGNAGFRLVAGAAHSFDRGTAVENIGDASVSPAAPTIYIEDDGSLVHPLADRGDRALVDRDLMVYGVKAGYGRKGAAIGSQGDDAALFRADMETFWRAAFC